MSIPSSSDMRPSQYNRAVGGPKSSDATNHTSLPERQPKAVQGRWGTVKAVLSGDTLVLVGKSSNPAIVPPEKTITLNAIQAPRFSRGPRSSQGDEPYAFQSREFLRNMLAGQSVRFVVKKGGGAGGREYGDVFFNRNHVAEAVVRNGWARAKGPLQGQDIDLREIEQKARDEAIGMWQEPQGEVNRTVREIIWNPDPQDLFERCHGKRLPAIVDFVRDGSTLRCELVSGTPILKHTMITLYFAGVKCPNIPPPLHIRQQNYENRRKELGPDADLTPPFEEATPKYAEEAKRFTETRLLHRTVHVVLQGCDKTGNLFGTIEVPQGNIGVLLLNAGYATVVPWSAKYTQNPEVLYQAEQVAKRGRYRLWKTHGGDSRGAERKTEDRKEFVGKVMQVFTGDTISVQDPVHKDSKHELRIILSSIRAPKFANRFNNNPTEHCAYEAKENLRSRLIGKKVKVNIEYKRTAPENSRNAGDRIYATVWQGKQNISEAQVACGFAAVVMHGVNEQRSSQYDVLQAAEKRATTKKKGIHSDKKAPIPTRVDLSERFNTRDELDKEEKDRKRQAVLVKAKQYFEFMKAEKFGLLHGIVEFCFAGHRLKIFIPKQNCIISYVLAGIRCESPPRPGDPKPKEYTYHAEALDFTRSLCQQHNVQVEIEAQDKAGNFIGSLFINKKNLSCLLLEKGYAQVVVFRGSERRENLYAAQAVAQSKRLGRWTNYNPEEEAKVKAVEDELANQVEFKSKVIQVQVSDIRDAAVFYIQIIGSKDLEAIDNRIKDSPIPEVDMSFHPSKGTICIGQFQDEWYRCRIQGRNPGPPGTKKKNLEFRVHYVDYGNEDILTVAELRPLDNDDPLKNIPFQSRQCTLAGVRGPPTKQTDYVSEAAMAFNSMVMGRPLGAQIELEERDMLHVILAEPNATDEQLTINRQLTRAGWVRSLKYKNKLLSKQLRNQIKEDVELAKKDHRGIWLYGDCGSDDERDDKK